MSVLLLPEGLGFWHWYVWLATWFGAGLVEPLRAGLAVTSAVLVLFTPIQTRRVFWLTTLAVLTLAGTLAAGAWEGASGVSDDRLIVIDEVAGFAAAMAIIGAASWRIGGFTAIAFLALDRLKPWPFDLIEAVPGGIGVMLDDIALGLAIGVAVTVLRPIWRSRMVFQEHRD